MNNNRQLFISFARFSVLVLLLSVLIVCCKSKDKIPISVKDKTITPVTAITKLVLDSAFVEEFINTNELQDSSAQRLRNFYISRNFQYAWFTEDGLAEQARSFWNLRNHYLKFNHDSTLYDKQLDEKMKELTAADSIIPSPAVKRQIELQLTQNFFRYAQYAYAGKIDPEELQWHIPRKKLDAVALLDSLVKNKGNDIAEWEPVNEQYTLMQQQLIHYAEMEQQGPWIKIPVRKKFKEGDTDTVITQLKARLFSTGDLNQPDPSPEFDSSLKAAIKNAQHRFGYKENGIADSSLIKQLNVLPSQRIEQILINMERMRWLPKEQPGPRLVANIPEFKLHVYEDKTETMTMNIVVGKEGTSSVIFTDELKYIVFSPYWNVPSSITRNEIVPGMKRNSNYLASKNMEITGYSNGLPIVRQKPGGSNSLGHVKFIFPNSYNIYFHDTPSKSLFAREKRAFSHGCIRLEQPFELAKYLLRNDSSWTDEKIRTAMDQQEEKWVSLKKSIPVFITYFTSWVDADGRLNFRDDIYGHDADLRTRLFK